MKPFVSVFVCLSILLLWGCEGQNISQNVNTPSITIITNGDKVSVAEGEETSAETDDSETSDEKTDEKTDEKADEESSEPEETQTDETETEAAEEAESESSEADKIETEAEPSAEPSANIATEKTCQFTPNPDGTLQVGSPTNPKRVLQAGEYELLDDGRVKVLKAGEEDTGSIVGKECAETTRTDCDTKFEFRDGELNVPLNGVDRWLKQSEFELQPDSRSVKITKAGEPDTGRIISPPCPN